MRLHPSHPRIPSFGPLAALASVALLAVASTALIAQMGGAPMGGGQPPAAMPSPPATANVSVAGGTITIKYNSPQMRGRKIMGALVPYGKVWRTGANPATTLITSVPLKFGALLVPAGTHTLYSLPSEDAWQLILNNQTGQWGLTYNQSMGPGPHSHAGQADGRAAGGDGPQLREHHGHIDRAAHALGDDRPLRRHHCAVISAKSASLSPPARSLPLASGPSAATVATMTATITTVPERATFNAPPLWRVA